MVPSLPEKSLAKRAVPSMAMPLVTSRLSPGCALPAVTSLSLVYQPQHATRHDRVFYGIRYLGVSSDQSYI